jgi:hypothetical protein
MTTDHEFAVVASTTDVQKVPSPGVIRLQRYYKLSATPQRPASPSRASGWSSLTTLWGFPCCVRFPCVRAAATAPVQRLGVVLARLTQPYQPSPITLSGRPAHRPFRDPMRQW